MASMKKINSGVRSENSNVKGTKTTSIEVEKSAHEMFHRPSFYKIILELDDFEEVEIPHHFVKYIGDKSSDTAILRDPRGGNWHVNICRESKGIFLRDGLQEFTKSNPIRRHDFLLFTYCGNLCFDVKFFGKNGLERLETSIADGYEAAVSRNERRGSATKVLDAANSSRKGKAGVLETPFHTNRRGFYDDHQKKVLENGVGGSLRSDKQATDGSSLKGIETTTFEEAGESVEKRGRGKSRKHHEASFYCEIKSETECSKDNSAPLTLQASEGTSSRKHLLDTKTSREFSEAGNSVEKRRRGRPRKQPEASYYCEKKSESEYGKDNCVPSTFQASKKGSSDIETTTSAECLKSRKSVEKRRRGRPRKHPETFFNCENKSGTKCQKGNVVPLTIQASQGISSRDHLKASSHDEQKGRVRTQTQDVIQVDMHQLKPYGCAPGTSIFPSK